MIVITYKFLTFFIVTTLYFITWYTVPWFRNFLKIKSDFNNLKIDEYEKFEKFKKDFNESFECIIFGFILYIVMFAIQYTFVYFLGFFD